MLNKFELILDMLEKKLSLGSSHIIIKRLKDINPRDILIALVERLQKNQEQAKYSKIFAVTSGYDEVVSEDSKLYFISSRIEDAIEKRNSCSSSSIIVFDQSNNIKSSSFDAFYQITSKVMSLYLLDFYAELQTEASSKNFLEALKASANMYSIESLFEHLSNSIGENNLLDTSLAIQNMWRIGLVPDPDIFNPTLDLANRLIENRRVIVAMGQMCDAFWRRMLTTITKAKLVDPQRYMSGFRNITEFYRTGLKAALKDLDYSTVTDLLWPSKPIFLSKRGTSEENADKCIIEKNLRSVITELAKDRSTKNLELLNVLKRKIILGLENSVERIEMPDIIRKLKLKKHDRSIAEFVKRSCSIESWGGILNTCENTVKDCLSKNIKDFEAFTPTQQCVKLCGSPTTL
ncbi:MAG: hypothetical protein LBE09_04580, partial [Christensenellaceae bacterium]|nr:hypothetical protein [Christensenellaceae bacterium]